MGVMTSSLAVDNRQAITDNAFGLSNYSGNQAYSAPVFDFSTRISTSGSKSAVLGSGGGGNYNIQILDQGAIGKSFDFAAFSLSEVLAYLIDGAKRQQQAAQYTADTVSEAVKNAASTQSAAAAASAAAAEKLNEKNQSWMEKNGARLLMIGAGLGAVWYVWGRK